MPNKRKDCILEWGQIGPFFVAVQSGDVEGLIAAARTHREAAKGLGLWELAMLMAYPTDPNRRQLQSLYQDWDGIDLSALVAKFNHRLWLVDKRRHRRRCYKAAQRVAPDVLSA